LVAPIAPVMLIAMPTERRPVRNRGVVVAHSNRVPQNGTALG